MRAHELSCLKGEKAQRFTRPAIDNAIWRPGQGTRCEAEGRAGGVPVETCHTLRLQSREVETTIAESGEKDRPVMSSPCPCACNLASEMKSHWPVQP